MACALQMGSESKGGIVAYDMTSGAEKWKWTGDGTAYASPAFMKVGNTKLAIAMTATKMVALNVTDGKLLWEAPFPLAGRGGYNAATPIVDGQTLIYTGSSRGVTAVKFEMEGDKLVAKELWKNADKSVQFNTPVIKDGLLDGLTLTNELFCINVQTGKTPEAPP